MPEPDLATPIDAPLRWPERAEPQGAVHRKIQPTRVVSSGNNSPFLFRWMEDDPHEPIQREECPRWR